MVGNEQAILSDKTKYTQKLDIKIRGSVVWEVAN